MARDLDIQQALELTTELVSEAGRLAHDRFGRAQAQLKADGTPVTGADLMIERTIRQRLQRNYPDHAIYGEEDGLTGPPDAPFLWLIDPIDGTNNYVHSVPLWGVSLGLFHQGLPCLGVLDNDLLLTSAPNLPHWDYSVAVNYRNVGSAAYGMALVAAGSAIGFINAHWHLWDAGATLCLLKEAGALVTELVPYMGYS